MRLNGCYWFFAVIKQRLQMVNSPYKTVMDCIRNIYRQEGPKAFYLSYTTQLAMNIPFQSLHFMTYEFCQNITNSERCYNPTAHVISGAVAGGVAAALTTPLDVCKTLLNTQQSQVRMASVRKILNWGGWSPSSTFWLFESLSRIKCLKSEIPALDSACEVGWLDEFERSIKFLLKLNSWVKS